MLSAIADASLLACRRDGAASFDYRQALLHSMSRSALSRQLMNDFDECNRVVDGSLLNDTMSQIENMPGPPGSLVEHFFNSTTNDVPVREQYQRIEIALDGPILANDLPALV